MGFELNRLMKQYGVGTAGRVNYSGASPVDPGARPVATDKLTGEELATAQAKYDDLLSKYNVDKANQPADTAAYDAYSKEYQTRLQNTPMYLQSQFQTGYEPKSEALKYAQNNMGVDQFNKNIQNWASQNPTAYSGDINAYAQKYGIGAQDIYNATQNRWGNVLQAPKFSAPDTTTQQTATTTNTAATSATPSIPITSVAPYTPPIEPPAIPPEQPVQQTNDEPELPPYLPSIYTKPIVSSIPNNIVDPNNIPLIIPSTPFELPELPDLTDLPETTELKDASYWDDTNSPDFVGPTRGGGGDLPEEFDKYLSTGNNPYEDARDAAAPIMDTYQSPDNSPYSDARDAAAPVMDIYQPPENNPYSDARDTVAPVMDAYQQPQDTYQPPENAYMPPITVDDATAVGIQDAVDAINNQYEIQPWENLDSSGFGIGSMAGDNSLNSDKNTYIGDVIDTPSDNTFGDFGETLGGNANFNFSNDVSGGGGGFDNYEGGGSGFGGGAGDFGGLGGGKFLELNDMAEYAKGGPVKTHYQTAGSVQLPSGYESPEDEADWKSRWESQRVPVETGAVDVSNLPPPIISEPAPAPAAPVAPAAPLTAVAVNAAKNTATPPAPAAVAAPKPVPVAPPVLGSERMGGIQALLAAYGPKDSAYGEELKAARATAKAESDAFTKMLSDAMKSPEDEKSSKAEMYFRLAAAFGAPTKTGHFAENLGMVGKELGEYSKEKRASAQQKLALALKGQEMKMGAAKDDLRTLQTLAGEEMRDKRTIATELIKDYIKSGEPQSAAGKQAVDEGLKPGTPEYQKRVETIGNMNIEGKLAQINASLANVSTAQANLILAQNKFENQKTQQAKLSPSEVKMKSEAEDLIASSKQSLADLKQAYALNPNSLAGGWLDKGQQFLSEAAGSKDPVIVNTRILNNLLGSQGLAKLKATFGGSPTEGERAILMELEGIGSKTKEERAAVIKRAYKVLQDRTAREQARLDQITSGAYRMTTPLEEGTE